MKFLTFIRHSESYRQSEIPAGLFEAMGKFVEKSMKVAADVCIYTNSNVSYEELT